MAEVTQEPLFSMTGVSKSFGATLALDSVALSVAPGEVRALLGENGAGKSTLMKVLSGAIEPDSGQMTLCGALYRPKTTSHARTSGIAMIYQELSMAPHLTVAENIALGLEPGRFGLLNRARMRKQAADALTELGHPGINPDAPVGELPVAIQQVIEIARAIANGCRVLVLDEPTSSLAKSDVERLFALIKRLKSMGHAVVYITHFLEEAKQIADTFTVLRDGRVANADDMGEATVEGIIEMMIGRQVDNLYPHSARVPGGVILNVSNLAGAKKPMSASLEVRRGEVLGIAGLVGAGRTELLRSIFGLDPVRRGEIKIGLYTGPTSPARRWSQGVGLLSEDRKTEGLALSLSIADNLTLSKLDGMGPAGLVLPKKQEAAVAEWVERLDIRCRSSRQTVQELSGGNQQKVAIGRLLRHDVDVLLLDEPTRGIDVASKALIYKLIDEMVSPDQPDGRPPKAIVMVSSYNRELLGICDSIAVMCRGRLSPAEPAEALDERTLMLKATGSEAA